MRSANKGSQVSEVPSPSAPGRIQYIRAALSCICDGRVSSIDNANIAKCTASKAHQQISHTTRLACVLDIVTQPPGQRCRAPVCQGCPRECLPLLAKDSRMAALGGSRPSSGRPVGRAGTEGAVMAVACAF